MSMIFHICPGDPRKFILRPASVKEAGLFYSQMEPEQDAAEGTVRHLRMDFGSGGLHHSRRPYLANQTPHQGVTMGGMT